MKAWVNGQIVDAAEARVSAFDHAFTVGDGVFETVKVTGGRAFAITRHLDRLTRSAVGLGLPLPDDVLLALAVGEILAANAEVKEARLRITVTGGPAPLGSDRGSGSPSLVLAMAPLAGWPAYADVVTVPWTRNERSATVGLKTTSYAENVVALTYAHERDAGEAIFCNTRGRLCEGTGSNIFVALDGRLLTPPIASGCLAGITRDLVLQWLPEVEEEDLPATALFEASEAFLTSSTRDIQPIRRVDGRALPAVPGPLTERAMVVFAERAAEDQDP